MAIRVSEGDSPRDGCQDAGGGRFRGALLRCQEQRREYEKWKPPHHRHTLYSAKNREIG